MPKAKKSMGLHDLFVLKLKALYDTENKLIKALPKMAKAATDTDLKAGFTEHAMETQGHIERLEKIFDILDLKPAKTTADGITGIVADAQWCIKNIKDKEALDAALAAAAQYAEHYEMAGYGTLAEWAKLMGHEEAAELLAETLEEEKTADAKLTSLATSKLNDQANTLHIE